MTISTIAVVGAGIMGSGIAQTFAVAGLSVSLIDVSDSAVKRGLSTIESSLTRLVKKEKISEIDKTAALSRIVASTSDDEITAKDLVVESATENEALKLKLLHDIDTLLKPEGIIVTNTSSFSITRLAAATSRPDKFMGMHFFNPVPVMELVELVRGRRTSDACFETVFSLVERLGKKPIAVRNTPGFVVNRILCPMINEAIFAYQEGLAPVEQIDAAMKLGANMPVGPLELADIIGLDTLLNIMETFYKDFDDPKYRPALLLKEMVDAGCLGRKVGLGFYRYD